MSLEEALVASTLNSAASLGMAETHGSIEVGKKADLVLVDIPM
jgi:imidazolonepropionase